MVAISDHDRALWVTIPLGAILREQIYHQSLWPILHKQLRILGEKNRNQNNNLE